MPSRRKMSGMRYAGLGVEFAAAVGGLTVLGYWIDRHYGSEPWGLLIGAGIGLVGGMYNMIREAMAAARASQEEMEASASGSEKDPGHQK